MLVAVLLAAFTDTGSVSFHVPWYAEWPRSYSRQEPSRPVLLSPAMIASSLEGTRTIVSAPPVRPDPLAYRLKRQDRESPMPVLPVRAFNAPVSPAFASTMNWATAVFDVTCGWAGTVPF